MFPYLYNEGPGLESILDFLGMIIVMSGIYLRMAARGHKRSHSSQGHALVMTGPYSFVRNPMYLGSFLMGAGFILLVWPWWSLPLFAFLFYVRFSRQVRGEEQYLASMFTKDYEEYCRRVPQIFPTPSALQQINFVRDFPPEEAFSTKEKRGLLFWPLLAIVLETFQELVVYGQVRMAKMVLMILFAIVVFGIALWTLYVGSSHAQNSK